MTVGPNVLSFLWLSPFPPAQLSSPMVVTRMSDWLNECDSDGLKATCITRSSGLL